MSEQPDEFDQLLDRLLEAQREDSTDPRETEKLEQLLISDPALRARYRNRIRIEEELAATFEKVEDSAFPFQIEEKTPWPRSKVLLIAGIAAGIVAWITTLALLNPHEKVSPTVATLEMRSADTWDGPLILGVDSRVGPGEIHLRSGTARFRFDSGALVTLEGPATLVIETAMRARLLHGNALIEAPEEAHGFAIDLPHGETIDLGTKFSVTASSDSATCEVLEGRVLMRHADTKQEEYLDQGGVMKITDQGIAPVDHLPSSSFCPEFQKRVVLKTSAETTVVKLNGNYHSFEEERARYLNDQMLLVKMEPESRAQRRALFNFDLRQIGPKEIESVRLNLNLVPSGLGFSAYLPEKISFAVYGITDESKETWPAMTPRWEKAPGYVADDDSSLNFNEVTLLGKFEVDRGDQNRSCSIETTDLQEFLQKDTTGKIGFLVVRETYGTNNFSLVHAFASSQHPKASGPSLEVTFVTE
jgi:ferric-dicitrate binding protein FerR (iron transport regulator)